MADSTLSLVRRSASTALSRLNPMSVSSRMLASDGATTEEAGGWKEKDSVLDRHSNRNRKSVLAELRNLARN